MNKRIPGKPGMPDKPGGEEPEGMEIKYTIPLSEIVNEFSFEKIYLPEDYESIKIVTPEVIRETFDIPSRIVTVDGNFFLTVASLI